MTSASPREARVAIPALLMHPAHGEAVLRRVADRITEVLSSLAPVNYDQLVTDVTSQLGCLREDVAYALARLNTVTLPDGTLRLEAT